MATRWEASYEANNRAPVRGRVHVGTSGWNYKGWRGTFFPKGLKQAEELAYIASKLGSVEVNGTFYGLTRPTACAGWRAAVPPDFLFAIKASRYLTHMLKLAKFEAPLANFFASGILLLGRQLGPILWQLPPMLGFQRERVETFLRALPRDVAAAEAWARQHDDRLAGRAAVTAPDGRACGLRHAFEPRHPSWFTDEALGVLEEHHVALVAADTAGKHPFSMARTADFAYVRLHGSEVLYSSQYSDAEIATWAERVDSWASAGADVYVYFDNDAKSHAPFDAIRLARATGALPEAAGDVVSMPAIAVGGQRQRPARHTVAAAGPARHEAVRRR